MKIHGKRVLISKMLTHFFLWTANFYAHDWLARLARFTFNQLKPDARDHTTIMAHRYWLPFPSNDTGLRRQKRQRL